MDLFGELKLWFVLPQRAPARVAGSEPLDASSFLIYNPSEAANVDFQQNVYEYEYELVWLCLVRNIISMKCTILTAF